MGTMSIFLSGCTQKLAIIRQPERLRYAQLQNIPAEKNADKVVRNNASENKISNAGMESTCKGDAAIEKGNSNCSIVANRNISSKHYRIPTALSIKNKLVVSLKEASVEHYKGRRSYALHALFYAVVGAILLIGFIALTKFPPADLRVDPALFLVFVAFLIAFFLFLVCVVAFFKVKRTPDVK